MKNLWKKLTSIALAIGILACFASCSKDGDEELSYTFDEILSVCADDTNIDELMKEGSKFEITTVEGEKEQVDFLKAVEELETRLDFNKKMAEANIASSKNISNELKEIYKENGIEDASLLLADLESDDLSQIEKGRVRTYLAYLSATNKNWLNNNGLNISKELLMRIVKAAGCEASGLEEQYYTNCTISPIYVNEQFMGKLAVDDPLSETVITYQIPNSGDVISDATLTLYNMQGLDNPSYAEVISYCEKTLETSKLAVAAGVEITNGQIDSKLNAKEAKQLILEKTAPSTTNQEG